MSLRVFAVGLGGFFIGVSLAGGATNALPPSPTINSAPSNPSNNTSASFGFSDTDPAVTFRCRLDGGAFSLCLSPASYQGLAEGVHTFDVKAVDLLLNESDLTSYTWVIDTTAPPPPSISGPPNPSNSSGATFTFSDTDPTVSFHCRLDANGLPPCTNPTSYSGLADGPHTLRATAVDPAGNTSGVRTYMWTIDTKPPPTPAIGSGPPDPSGSKAARFVFSDAEAGASFSCRLDSAPFSPCSSPKDYSSLGDGPHSFTVKAVDAAGNQSSPTPPYIWTIDSVNPVVTLTDRPPAVTNATIASFTFSANKSGSIYACKLDAGGFSGCTSPRLYDGLADGSHTFSVRATAPLGNTGPTTEYTWTVDTVAPLTTITSAPSSVSSLATANFTFTSSEQGSTFACSLDAGGLTACATPQTYAGLGDGTHTFRVQAVDAAGNADPTPASYSWQIVGVGPATVDRTPPGNVRGLRRAVGYRILKLVWTPPSDGDFDHVKVFLSTTPKSSPRTLVYKGTGRRYTNKRFKNGLYYRYAVLSYDHAGNASRGIPVMVPPSVLLRSPRNGAVVGTPPRLAWLPVAKATYYNVQLYSPTDKLLSAWPAKARLALSRSWSYGGRRFSLRKGRYRWFVWPGFGARSRGRYGQLLGQGSFRVG